MKKHLLLSIFFCLLTSLGVLAQMPMQDARESYHVLKGTRDGKPTEFWTPVDPPVRTHETDLNWYRTEGLKYGIDQQTVGAWPQCNQQEAPEAVAECTRSRLDAFFKDHIQEALPYESDTIYLHLSLSYEGQVSYRTSLSTSGASYAYLLKEITAKLPRFEPVDSEYRRAITPAYGQVLIREVILP